MGRHKIPSKEKKDKGTYRDYRENLDEPEPENKVGGAPDFLTDKQKEVWAEIKNIAHIGVLSDADSIIVEIAARLLSELRENNDLSVGKMSHLIGCLARMGLTPSDRSKVSAPNEKRKKDPWEKFGGKLKAVK